jgi:hypothetical protein
MTLHIKTLLIMTSLITVIMQPTYMFLFTFVVQSFTSKITYKQSNLQVKSVIVIYM